MTRYDRRNVQKFSSGVWKERTTKQEYKRLQMKDGRLQLSHPNTEKQHLNRLRDVSVEIKVVVDTKAKIVKDLRWREWVITRAHTYIYTGKETFVGVRSVT